MLELSKLLRGMAPAAAATAMLAAGAGYAQTYAPLPPAGPEQLYVYGPRIQEQNQGFRPLGAPPPGLSISVPVSYADLDLRTSWGAYVLRQRIVDAAASECQTLYAVVPYAISGSQPCFRTAVNNAFVRANGAISRARWGWWYGY